MRPPIRALTPLLLVSDLERSIDFYCRCLGFVEPNVHGDPACFGMIHRDGFDLMPSVAEGPDGVRPLGRDGTWDVHVRVSDVHVRVSDLAAEIAASRAAGVRSGTIVRFESKSIGAVFEGDERAGGDEIAGRWSQQRRAWPLVLRPKDAP